MLRLTDAFIWEDLPLTDHDSGSLGTAVWIPRIRKITIAITGIVLTYHGIQNSITLSTSNNHPMIYGTWYPFDTSISPVYELVVITQVRVFVVKFFSTECTTLHG
jgi:hypothetical protein